MLSEYGVPAQQFERLPAEPDAPAETLSYLMRCLHHAGGPARAVAAWHAAPERLKTVQAAGV